MIQYTYLTSAYKELCSIQNRPSGATNISTIFLLFKVFFQNFSFRTLLRVCSSKVRLPLFQLGRVLVAAYRKNKNLLEYADYMRPFMAAVIHAQKLSAAGDYAGEDLGLTAPTGPISMCLTPKSV